MNLSIWNISYFPSLRRIGSTKSRTDLEFIARSKCKRYLLVTRSLLQKFAPRQVQSLYIRFGSRICQKLE